MLAHNLKPENVAMFQTIRIEKNRTKTRRRPRLEACEGRLLLSNLVAAPVSGPHVTVEMAVSPLVKSEAILIKHGW